MIDDINTSNKELWKYVDDTTIAECVDKKEESHIQSDVEELIAKSNQNKFQLNESKCKELRGLCSHCYQWESNRGSVHC